MPEDTALSSIRLVGFDVDGVFTDGRLYFSDDGTETKAFSTQDGYGIRRLLRAGVEVAVISGRRSTAVEHRMAQLGVVHVVLGSEDKVADFEDLIGRLGIESAQCAFVGDDVPDLPLLERVGHAFAVANAIAAVRRACRYTTDARGGFGAVREVCDLIADAKAGSPE